MSTLGLALGLTGLLGGLVLALVATFLVTDSRDGVARSLAGIQAAGGGVAPGNELPDFTDRILIPAYRGLGRLARRFSPAGANTRLARMLDRAGNPPAWTVERIFGFKGLGLVGAATFGALLGRHSPGTLLLAAAGGGLAGFYLPDLLLYNAAVKREDRIRKTLPDALDLLTISVEAGLGFDSALSQVARNTDGPLAGEFFRVLQEMQIGKTRQAAFSGLSERTKLPELRTFVTALVQADALGIPIANVLREQAREMRVKRRQRAEMKAQQVPVKIMFPLVLFIFPCLFIVVLGPGVITISQNLLHR